MLCSFSAKRARSTSETVPAASRFLAKCESQRLTMFVTIMRFVTLVCGVFILFVGAQQIDPNGYIVYCPCMGT